MEESQHSEAGPPLVIMKLTPKLSKFFQNYRSFKKYWFRTDRSKMSDKALSYAIYLSKISSSDIFILNIVEKYSDLKEVLPTTIKAELGEGKEWDKISNKDLHVRIEGALRRVIEDKVRLCKEAGVVRNITFEIHTGNPAEEIIKVASRTEFGIWSWQAIG